MFSLPQVVPPNLMMGEIQHHEKIVNTIYAMWGEPELNEYLSNLLTTQRANREGFSSKIFTELNCILAAYQKQFPQYVNPFTWV